MSFANAETLTNVKNIDFNCVIAPINVRKNIYFAISSICSMIIEDVLTVT